MAGSPGEPPAFVPPGTGWPDDPATPATPVAGSPAAVRALAGSAGTLAELTARQSVCRACPRLVEWRERVAVEKRRSFRAERYWGRPIPGWGAEQPRVLIVGLAPAAHGGNRTGRIFTGDRSGDVLYASLWRVGLAAQETSVTAGDGQRLLGARMAAAVRCAPPQNKPSVTERDACAPWLTAELEFVAPDLRAVVCLGHFAWQAIWPQLAAAGWRGAQAAPAVRPRRRGAGQPRGRDRWRQRRAGDRPGTAAVILVPRGAKVPAGTAAGTSWSSAAITPASRTPLPAG